MKNTERTLDSLRNAYEGHVYLSFNSQQEYDDFLTAAESEGYRFGEHLPTEHLGEGWDIIALQNVPRARVSRNTDHLFCDNNS